MGLGHKQKCVSEHEHDESHRWYRKLCKTANDQLLFTLIVGEGFSRRPTVCDKQSTPFPLVVPPDCVITSITKPTVRCHTLLRWDPWHQGTGALGPGPRAFFYLVLFFHTHKKNCFLSVFSLFHSLFLSFSVHTLSVLLSLINFTNVSCEGKLKKGVAYKL
jgi:hypothetical protein